MQLPGFLSAVLAVTLLVGPLNAQPLGSFPTYRPSVRYRVDNGVIISWTANHTDSEEEVQVHDLQGRLLTHFGVLRNLSGAATASIWDVAVQPNKLIAVAATYPKRNSIQNSLLIFDFSGNLLSRRTLPTSRGIAQMAIDSRMNIWTLTQGAGNESPSRVPMLVEYNSSGTEIRRLLSRADFPPYQQIINALPQSGQPNLGIDGKTLWFWLPASGDLVNVDTETAAVTRTNTGHPNLSDGVFPSTLYRISDSQYALATLNRNSDAAPSHPVFLWSPQSHQWAAANLGNSCGDHHFLFGILEHKPLFLGESDLDLCAVAPE